MARRFGAPSPTHTRHRERGQVAVIFGGAIFLFVLLAACVIDLSWYWTNNLRMQRAADAAALAGVVFL
ncbi:MAG TPA: pilus assembly protein TadG-related protein, partial [Candidatus Limnocylindrales bacterium]